MSLNNNDFNIDSMNHIQLAGAALLEGMSYVDYKTSAEAYGKHVLTEVEYSTYAQLDMNKLLDIMTNGELEMNKSIYDILKPGDHWISVTQGMSGYFAVEMWLNNEDSDMIFAEPYDTGFGRYATYGEAKDEAMEWAVSEQLPFIK